MAESKALDRPRMAITKWIPYSAAGAAFSFLVGFLFSLPPPQVIVAAATTATLVFSGLAMQSYGREKKTSAIPR